MENLYCHNHIVCAVAFGIYQCYCIQGRSRAGDGEDLESRHGVLLWSTIRCTSIENQKLLFYYAAAWGNEHIWKISSYNICADGRRHTYDERRKKE